MSNRDIVERLRANFEHVKRMGLLSPRFSTEEVGALFDEITRLRTALAAAQGAQWHPIESAPKDGRKIIVSYVNHNGKTRTVMARWLTQEAADEIDHEGVGLEAGWFECIDNWSDYTEVAIHEGEPTHWMPIPAAPGASPPAALAVPAGMALVPVEPTPEMVAAMARAWQLAVENDDPNECIAEYRAAIAAAPRPQQAAQAAPAPLKGA